METIFPSKRFLCTRSMENDAPGKCHQRIISHGNYLGPLLFSCGAQQQRDFPVKGCGGGYGGGGSPVPRFSENWFIGPLTLSEIIPSCVALVLKLVGSPILGSFLPLWATFSFWVVVGGVLGCVRASKGLFLPYGSKSNF